MDTRKIPPIITLSAALVASIVTYVCKYELRRALVIILVVIVGFYILSCFIKLLFDKLGMNIEAIEEKRKEAERQKKLEEEAAAAAAKEAELLETQDGSVIEKDS